MSDGTPNAIEFLHALYPEGLWALTSIQPDRKAIETRTFLPSEHEKAAAWIDKYNGKRNIYFHVNQPKKKLSKKADKTDIAAAFYLHVDVDPRAGEPLEAEQERIRGLLDNWSADFPEPHIAICSGGGMQLFWRLEACAEIGGSIELAEEFERYNKALEVALGGDNCHNVDRIMRLPGTMNIPDEKKLKKGRVPVMAETLFIKDGVVKLEDMPQVAKSAQSDDGSSMGGTTPKVQISGNVARIAELEELDEWGIADKLKIVIAQGALPQDELSDKQRHFSRSEWVFYACTHLIRAQVPDEVIFSLITDPGWAISEHILAQKGDTSRYAIKQIERAHEHAIDPMLRQLNERYAVIKNLGGKCLVVEEVYDDIAERSRLTKMSFANFQNAWMNRMIQIGVKDKTGEPIFKPAGKWWLEHAMRREFDTLIFAPNREVPGAYNLWQGYACEPVPGDCSLFLEHMKNIICSGNEEYYTYLLSWMARTVQFPNKSGQSAVILRGKQGTGKSLFVKTFGELFGRHFLQVADAKHLVGSFNAHLRDCVVLFGDEAFYAGDRKHESVLKTLVTEDTIHYESKGIDSEQGRNFVHLVMASNSTWVVPADMDDRRFLVLDVSQDKAGDREYFNALVEQMEAGGKAALLHHLLNYDITGFQVRDVPKTAALHEQKLLSLEPIEEWWYNKLRDGILLDGQSKWETVVRKDSLLDDYIEYTKAYGVSRRGNATVVGHFLNRVVPDLITRRVQCEIDVPVEAGFTIKKTVTKPHYHMPDLQECRSHWAQLAQSEGVDWPDIEPVQEELPDADVPF